MPVSLTSSKVIFNALKQCDIRMLSALPETWLVHLIHMAEEDPDVILVRLAKEEEGVGISAGAYFAGVKSAMLMQNHGFLASINGIVSFAHLYKIPLLMLISYRGTFGERDPGRRKAATSLKRCCAAWAFHTPFSTKSRLSRSASGRRKRLRKAACNLSLFY